LNKQPTGRSQAPDEEAELDRRIQSLLGDGPDAYTPEDWCGLREQLRLDLLYAGQFVAYRDHYEGEGDRRRLVRREVLHASATLDDLHEHLGHLPAEQQRGATVSYIEPK
jgi:hypothetical protein